MDNKKHFSTPLTEEDYFKLEPNTKRYYKGNRPIYDDAPIEEDDSVELIYLEDE